MDKTVHRILEVLLAEIQTDLSGLGDFPKADPFEHGVQVGVYRGMQKARSLIAAVLEDME